MRYKLTPDAGTIRRDDGACIPADPANYDYLAYLDWLRAGNIPDPADAVAVQSAAEALLSATDARMIRVLDSLLDNLSAKRVLALTDLPPADQAVIQQRKAARQGSVP
jgi:hypothetical protein